MTKRTNLKFSQRWKCSNCDFILEKQVWVRRFNLEGAREQLQLSSFQTSQKLCFAHDPVVRVAWKPRPRRMQKSRHAKEKGIPNRYNKGRLQRDPLFDQTSTLPNQDPTTRLRSATKPTSLARMGSSYITPRAPYCPGVYPQLSKPYRFGAPISFYSLLLVSFLSWLHSSDFIRVWSRRVLPPGTSSDDIGSTSTSSSSSYCVL